MRALRRGKPPSLLLALPSGGLTIALTTQIAALSWLLETRYHLAIEDVALVWAAGPLAGIVGQLAVGHASDRTWLLVLLAGLIALLLDVAINIGLNPARALIAEE